MGILTPIPLDITTSTITNSEIAINGIWKDSKITMISNPIRMNKMALRVSSKRCQNL